MIRGEMYKSVRRLRTWAAFGALAALPIIATIGTALSNEPEDPGQRSLYTVSTASGINNAIAALAFMSPFFLVIVIAVFGGETVAGEAQWGTLRSLLIRPVGRIRLLLRKLSAAALLSLAATLWIAVVALIAGTIAFGWHGVTVPVFGEIWSANAGALRLLLAVLYVAWSLVFVLTFAFMIGTMTDQPYGAMGVTVGLAVASQILDALPALKAAGPWLPTHYLFGWQQFFISRNISWDALSRGVGIQLLYGAVFCGIAFWWFRRKDILS
jgi:ABC-2 type transport system permease protein